LPTIPVGQDQKEPRASHAEELYLGWFIGHARLMSSLQKTTEPPAYDPGACQLVGAIASRFQIPGDFLGAIPYGSGHINDTFAAWYNQGGTCLRYLHQRINTTIFRDPVALMENIGRVTTHIQGHLRRQEAMDRSRRGMILIPTDTGDALLKTAGGECWRTYVFIEGAHTRDAIQGTKEAYEAARAFGAFQGLLADLEGGRMHETIPDFHHTPRRLAALDQMVAKDPLNRVAEVGEELAFVRERSVWTGRLIELQAAGHLPERVTHNDTKLNNVMLDNASGKGLCVIDLDTVMPGLALYDFGDMVRTATSPAAEDEQDLSKVEMRMEYFEALVHGYVESAESFLNATELEYLAFSGKLITLEIGVRFLTDFLAGDVYFKTKRERHNLDRCRTQFRLVASIEEQEEAMNHLVRSVSGKSRR